MVNYDVHYTTIPESFVCMNLPDGAVDVWVRKDIQQEKKVDDQGKKYVDYFAVEAYARLNNKPNLTEDNFDEVFQIVAEWEPETHAESKPNVDAAVQQIRADIDYIAMVTGVEL